MEEPKIITIGDVIDSTVMHINKGTHFLRRNPKGTHTELKGNPVTRIKMLNIYYSCLLMLWFTRWAIQLFNHLLGLPNRASLRYLRYKHSDIHVKVLSLQNRKSFEYFFCFHRTLGISPKDLEGFKADIAFIYTALAFHKFELWFDFCNAEFHWFVRYQMRVLIG